ncbi:hypothetical protein DFH07DRAFT_129394 [Mycena maculata]|uniref:Uncharacterized protein n=1 Tax=Mycena maculata TaxID=230809 RepID=A0AAD7I3U5_9AGAR|nr:hypothetical protein DFH07DRAFT_129394 [Mycena maculata]
MDAASVYLRAIPRISARRPFLGRVRVACCVTPVPLFGSSRASLSSRAPDSDGCPVGVGVGWIGARAAILSSPRSFVGSSPALLMQPRIRPLAGEMDEAPVRLCGDAYISQRRGGCGPGASPCTGRSKVPARRPRSYLPCRPTPFASPSRIALPRRQLQSRWRDHSPSGVVRSVARPERDGSSESLPHLTPDRIVVSLKGIVSRVLVLF